MPFSAEVRIMIAIPFEPSAKSRHEPKLRDTQVPAKKAQIPENKKPVYLVTAGARRASNGCPAFTFGNDSRGERQWQR